MPDYKKKGRKHSPQLGLAMSNKAQARHKYKFKLENALVFLD
jgi:hypothetical protein